MTRQTIEIGGMSCGHCVKTVRDALSQVKGVSVDDVRIGTAIVSFDEAAVAAELVTDAVRDAGYDVRATKAG